MNNSIFFALGRIGLLGLVLGCSARSDQDQADLRKPYAHPYQVMDDRDNRAETQYEYYVLQESGAAEWWHVSVDPHDTPTLLAQRKGTWLVASDTVFVTLFQPGGELREIFVAQEGMLRSGSRWLKALKNTPPVGDRVY